VRSPIIIRVKNLKSESLTHQFKQAKKIHQKKKNSPEEKEFTNTSNNKDINILVVLYVLSI